MKAIMLSYDNNHRYCELAYRMYMDLWPTCPYHFYIPWNEHKPKFFTDKSNVTLVQCSSRIMPTMQALLDGVEDDEWVYWCIDDRFPVYIDMSNMQQLHDQLYDYIDFDFVRPYYPPFPQKIINSCNIKLNYFPSDHEYMIQNKRQEWGYYMHQYCKAQMLKRIYFKGDLDTIDDFHVYVMTSIHNTVGLIRSDSKLDFMRFKEPLIDGKETSDGRNYLNNLNIK